MAILELAGAIEQRKLDVFDGAGAGKQIELLKNEADLLVANLGKLVAAQGADIHAVQVVGAGSGLVETAQDIHHGGFARAGGSHDGDEASPLDFQGHSAKGVHGDVAELVDLR